MTDAAVKAPRPCYVGAGTVEFIADGSAGLKPDRIWFMEMNTRLQVEHPVTEQVTGLDLVEWQFRVAAGEPLPLKQAEIGLTGHAVEARLYAESPVGGLFLPSTGVLEHFALPPTVRAGAGVEEGGEVTPFYDPMIAKLIAHAPTREAAAAKLALACRAIEVAPVKTNAAFLARCLEHPDFVAGAVDTGFIEARIDGLLEDPPAPTYRETEPRGPCPRLEGFRINAAPAPRRAYSSRSHAGAGEAVGDGSILSPMPGKIVAVQVASGDAVKKGQPLVTLEAMKMEHALTAPFDGKVVELPFKAGDQVSEGVLLVKLEASPP